MNSLVEMNLISKWTAKSLNPFKKKPELAPKQNKTRTVVKISRTLLQNFQNPTKFPEP